MTRVVGGPDGEGGEADCLEPEIATGFVQGWLSADERAQAELHIDRCPDCRRHVSDLAKASTGRPVASDPLRPDDAPGASGSAKEGHEGGDKAFSRGTTLGRYVLDGPLGSGAMGVVYAAFDPKLDRKVALKMLHAWFAGAEAHERLLREARAMARLSHPNVVSVYDVDTQDGRLFLAMEYVEGVTLRSWLRRESRPTREVLRALVQAGRGIAAAHAVGVVHRDVKPDNVLVDGRGRVCVTDFGLARAPFAPGALAPAPGDAGRAGAADASATRTGAVVGTPAYMAPEQHLGRAADAASDQFSFCVMLYEALYRERPFEGPTLQALAEAVTGGKVREPPARSAVPPRVYKALLRGLSVEPRERFASMGDLLDALADDPTARRRRAAAALGAAVALSALPLTYRLARSDARPSCGGAERRLAGAWDEARRGAVREAFLGTGKPFAADAWREVERALDAYARDWAASRVDACEATHVRGEQSAELLDLRVACLDERQKELGALTEVFARADAGVVARAVGAAWALSPLAPCADAKALRASARAPADPATAAELEALRGELSRVKALREAGKFREALAIVEGVVWVAEAPAGRPLWGRALLAHGHLQVLVGDVKGAEASLWRALAEADVVGDDVTRARAWSSLISVGYEQGRGDAVPFYDGQARAALARTGGDAEIDATRRFNLATVFEGEGKFDEALSEYQTALPVFEKAFGPESRQVTSCLGSIGNIHQKRGDLDAAWAFVRRALDVDERALGPHNPHLGPLLNALGTILDLQLRPAEAAAYFERALLVMRGALGPESSSLWPFLNNLGDAFNDQGDYGRALPYLQSALAFAERHFGPDHPLMTIPLASLGQAYLGLGDRGQAIAHLERAVRGKSTPDTEVELARAQFALARALSESGREPGRARTLALAARDAYRALNKSPRYVRDLRLVEQWLERRPRG